MLTVFALTKLFDAQGRLEPLEVRLRSREEFSGSEIRAIHFRRNFLVMLQRVSACGCFYFVSSAFLIFALTCDGPEANLTLHAGAAVRNDPLYTFLLNLGFVSLLVATFYNAFVFVTYRVFIFRLH